MTQKMSDEAVDDCLSALKFVPDWFVINKMIKNLHDALFTNDDILFFDEYYGNVSLFANKMIILGVMNLNNAKHFKREYVSKELTPLQWHPKW